MNGCVTRNGCAVQLRSRRPRLIDPANQAAPGGVPMLAVHAMRGGALQRSVTSREGATMAEGLIHN